MGSTETKLSRLAQTKADIKNAIINKGVEIDDTTPFKDYAAKIEEIKASSGTGLNIFCQETEPDTKDGIWIKGDRTYDTVKVTDIVSSDPYWASTNNSALPFSLSTYSITRVQKGADVYIFKTNAGYRYNVVTGDYETITFPASFYPYISCLYNDDIYLFGKTLAYTYNTITKEFTQLATAVPFEFNVPIEGVLVDDYIYIFGGKDSGFSDAKMTAYKYSIKEDKYTLLATRMPQKVYGGWACKKVGDKIYILGLQTGTKTVYAYDIATDTYTAKASATHSLEYAQTIVCLVGTDIYYFGTNSTSSTNSQLAGKYDTVTNTHTALPNIPRQFYYGVAVAYYNNKFYLMGGRNTPNNITIMEIPVVEFENNSVVIQSGDLYKTYFMTPPDAVEGDLKTPFKDAFHYSDQYGLDGTLPTYYGDGTQWNKFKN